MTRLIALAGSTRRESLNKKLARAAADAARAAGAEVTLVDLGDYPMPLYDGDLEERDGIPERVVALKAVFVEHDGLIVASPEYNSSISGVLKNTIDWLSRVGPGEKPLAAFAGKTAALYAASPGALGGLRGLVTVRSILGNIGVHVIPEQLAVPRAHESFDADGRITDEGLAKRVSGVAEAVVRTTSRLRG